MLNLAQEEALLLQSEGIDTEHLLLGLTYESEGIAAKVFASLDIELSTISKIIKDGYRNRSHTHTKKIGMTLQAQKVLDLATAEAAEMKHFYTGTEHLLLGLLREEKGFAATILSNRGVNFTLAQEEIVKIYSQCIRDDDTPMHFFESTISKMRSSCSGQFRMFIDIPNATALPMVDPLRK